MATENRPYLDLPAPVAPPKPRAAASLIVLRDSHRGNVTEADIVAWAREHMAVYKYPRTVEFADALPRNASGKLMWRTLQAEQDAHDKTSSVLLNFSYECFSFSNEM